MKKSLKFGGILVACFFIGFFLVPSTRATIELNNGISILASPGDTITYNITSSNTLYIGQQLVLTFDGAIAQIETTYITAKAEILNRTSGESLYILFNSSTPIFGHNLSSGELIISNNTIINRFGLFGMIPLSFNLINVGESYKQVGFNNYTVNDNVLIVTYGDGFYAAAAARLSYTTILERDSRGIITNSTVINAASGVVWTMLFESTTIDFGIERLVPGYNPYLIIALAGTISVVLIFKKTCKIKSK
ncbi:MAG: hypothetical protein JW891_10855 [Candidatus Lokiarchaeota archaeon]|nr:hypothetical protein [Candidatus Lokiarchaeota archaeon]